MVSLFGNRPMMLRNRAFMPRRDDERVVPDLQLLPPIGMDAARDEEASRRASSRFLSGSVSPHVIVVPTVDDLPTLMKRAENPVNPLLLDAGLLSQLLQGHGSRR